MTRPPRVLHVLQLYGLGGASRGLAAMARRMSTTLGTTHRVLSLVPPSKQALDHARAYNLPIVDAADATAARRELDAADIVQVHWWNTPELVGFLSQTAAPMRTVLWSDVAGDTSPHVLTPALVDWADACVASSRYTAALPLFAAGRDAERDRKLWLVVAAADFDRVSAVAPEPHTGFHVGYIGTVDFAKMHDRYVPMHAALAIPEVRVLVYGLGHAFEAIGRQARSLGCAPRFDLRGYTENVAVALARFDVFGYPLAPDTFAAAEFVLQEAMYAGVPPVVFRHGGASLMVRDGDTGFVVDSERQYIAAVERLHARPAERLAMGRAAAAAARVEFDPDRAARQLWRVYEHVMARPRRPRRLKAVPARGAAMFVEALGGTCPEFAASLQGSDVSALLEAERLIRKARPAMASADAGGVLHYRRRFPDDAHLRLWAGLVLLEAGRPALAAAELRGAIQRGCDHWRVWRYLAEAAAAGGAHDLATEAAAVVRRDAPTFGPVADRDQDEGAAHTR